MAITLADFTRIWASTSPLTPYSFSESNYKEGWNFVGATPPARQMWDSIQKQNDEKLLFLCNSIFAGNPLTLTADDGNGNTVSLVGEPNGSLTWNGKEVERVNASGTKYVRFESGLQICWDAINITPNASGDPFNYYGVGTATFPVAFITTPCVFANVLDNAGFWNSTISLSSTTGVNISIGGYNQNQHGAQYVAIGRWK